MKKSKKTYTEKEIRANQAVHISKEDADFICRSMAGLIKHAKIYISPLTDCFTQLKGETDKDFMKRKENSAIKELMKSIINCLGAWMCEQKEFLNYAKKRANEDGFNEYVRNLFANYVLNTFYSEYKIADDIEACCHAAVNPPDKGIKSKGKAK